MNIAPDSYESHHSHRSFFHKNIQCCQPALDHGFQLRRKIHEDFQQRLLTGTELPTSTAAASAQLKQQLTATFSRQRAPSHEFS
eukprot:125531-Hanusia_phi.AAC.1